MVYENDMFIVYYSECDQRYIDKLLAVLDERVPAILDFFKLKLEKKFVIKLYDDLEEYIENITAVFKEEFESGKSKELRTFEDSMIANSMDGNINMESLDLVRQVEDFKGYSEEEFCYNAAHEFTHLCQELVGSNNPGWFWEVIATNLGNPECQQETQESFTLKELEEKFDKIDGYGATYKIGKYLFEHYDKDFILGMVKDNNELEKVMPEVINKVNNPSFKSSK